jgi:Flavodoxin
MRALIVFESMYGNTHEIAEQIGKGLAHHGDTLVVPVHDATPDVVSSADLLVVGGPTHAHGMTSRSTRIAAREAAEKPGSELVMDPEAAGQGLRDWFSVLGEVDAKPAAAFDTRVDVAAILSGRASHGITRRLRARGFKLVAKPQSFLVDKHNRLLEGEANRAFEWGTKLAHDLDEVSSVHTKL